MHNTVLRFKQDILQLNDITGCICTITSKNVKTVVRFFLFPLMSKLREINNFNQGNSGFHLVA